MGRRFSGNGGGRAPRAASLTTTVPAQPGALLTVGKRGLLAPVSYARIAGSSNLTIDSASGSVSATAALGAGATQSLSGTIKAADGCVIPFALSLTGAAAAPTVPASPTVTLTAGDGQVSVAWSDGADGGSAITGHKLYRGTSASGETLVGTIAGASPYVDAGLTDGTTYFYKLSAVNALGEGAQSAEQSATPTSAGGPIAGMPAYYLNFTAANTARLKAMKRAAQTGTGRGRILGGIDSFMAGYGATASTTDPWNGSDAASMMARAATFLNAKATPVPATSSFSAPDNGTSTMANLIDLDPRYAFGGTVAPLVNFPVLGGIPLKFNSAGWLEFTPGAAFDTIDLLVLVNTSIATLGISVDHGATNLQTISCQDTTKYVRRVTVTCPAGSTTARITGLSGTPCLAMIGTRNAADKKIEFVNAGMLSRKLADINQVPGSVANSDWNWNAGLAPFFDGNAINACILQGGYNDWAANGSDNAATAAALTTSIQNLQALGVDVVYVTYGNLNVAGWAGAAQTACVAAAVAAGIPVVDARQLMGTFAAENALGHWYDNFHMRPFLQDVVAQAVANIFDYL
jgi:hypothetical protein